ncbi:MAG TPA: B-box zinc finger protein [Acidobacteriaceae bacterium]|jgi:hypothetical protein|nr:B-box zinc finger protein [Acidobacteriaceae bacterium]
MNCVNHPEAAATAFCQNCGKALCPVCARDVQGNIFCEPCLAARITGAMPGTMPGAAPGPFGPGTVPPGMPPASAPNPGTAAVLGFIPGVGAMYNGQYIKAVIHVLVFVVLIGITEHYGLFGVFLAAWIFYQVFDAHQTAKARRDGLPLPDPFGLNELGNAIGGHTPPRPWTPPPPAGGPVPPAGVPGPIPGAAPGPVPGQPDWTEQVRQNAQSFGQQAGQWGEQLRQRIVADAHQAAQPYPPAGWAVPPVPPPAGAGYAPPPPPPGWVPPAPGAAPVPPPEWELERARREPIGAIVLILLGMLFLFNTLGFFNFGWVSHGWPIIIVAIAVWLLVRGRGGFHTPPPPGAWPPPPPAARQEPPSGGAQ